MPPKDRKIERRRLAEAKATQPGEMQVARTLAPRPRPPSAGAYAIAVILPAFLGVAIAMGIAAAMASARPSRPRAVHAEIVLEARADDVVTGRIPRAATTNREGRRRLPRAHAGQVR